MCALCARRQSVNKALRDAIADIEREAARYGATLTARSMAKHPKLTFKLADGRTFNHSICGTPSDHRSRLNDLSDLRRRLREMGATPNG